MSTEDLLQVENVSKNFRVQGRLLRAVQNVSFRLGSGSTLGLVGESGSGKSTLGRVVLRLLEADSGRVIFQGKDLAKQSKSDLRRMRTDMQIVFQDPLASLNPRMTIAGAIEDAMRMQGMYSKNERWKRTDELLERVGLPRVIGNAFPSEVSGGQQQRVGIARALSLNPKLVVCDEPISALDVSVQVQIIELLQDLQNEMGLSYLFISHNLGVVQYLSDSIMVLYLGEVVEHSTAEDLFHSPAHPYTQMLVNSILKVPNTLAAKRPLVSVVNETGSSASLSVGCPFHLRCPVAMDRCSQEKPQLREIAANHFASCHLVD